MAGSNDLLHKARTNVVLPTAAFPTTTSLIWFNLIKLPSSNPRAYSTIVREVLMYGRTLGSKLFSSILILVVILGFRNPKEGGIFVNRGFDLRSICSHSHQ